MKRETEILVIGGGAIGICAAHFLSEQNLKVAVVEKGEICSGCSYGNGGLIVPSHCVPLAAPGVVSKALARMFDPESPFYIKPRLNFELFSWLWKFRRSCNRSHVQMATPVLRALSLASLRLYDDLAARKGLAFGFQRKGMLKAFNTQDGLEAGIEEARTLQDGGVETRIMNPEEIRELEPNIQIRATGGVFYPQDAHLIPFQFVRQLARDVEERGVDIHTSTEVLGLETSGREIEIVRTTRGNFTAREIVLAGGSWSPGIARDLNLHLPIQPVKGYSITIKRPYPCPNIPISFGEAKVGVTPMGDTLRFGGTLELAGLDLSVNTRRVAAILKAIPHYFPDLDPETFELIEIWRGLRPCTPDGLALLGRPSAYDNLTIAAGHAMIGISLAPITGRLVSQLVARETPEIDLALLNVDRFA